MITVSWKISYVDHCHDLLLSVMKTSKVTAPKKAHLHSGVDAHVFQEHPLSDGPQTGHAPSSSPPQIAEVHVSREVGRAGGGQDVMELVTFKTLTNKKTK